MPMFMWIRLLPALAYVSPPQHAVELGTADIGPLGCPSTTLHPCSGHGSCGAHGQCSCLRGFAGLACERPEYLLACPHNCSAPLGGDCVKGRCICKTGRSGDDCADRTPVNCSAACASNGHGECIDGSCVCRPGFYGAECIQGCPGYVQATGKPCSGHGLCVATGSPGHSPDRCKCFTGFEGDACESDVEGVTTCPRGCSGHGTCERGRCTCGARYAGPDCSILLRHGHLAHVLDSSLARLMAVGACFAATSVLAALALRYINGGSKIAASSQGK